MSRSLLVAAVVALSATAAMSGARATTFVPMTDEALAAASDVILIGRVLHLEAAQPSAGGSIYTYVHVAPEYVLLGPDLTGATVVLRESGGVVKGLGEKTFGSPSFYVGERCLLFLSHAADGTLHTTEMLLGKYTLRLQADGTFTAERRYDEDVVALDPKRQTLEHPEPDVVALVDLVHRIRASRPQASAPEPFLVPVPPELSLVYSEYQAAYALMSPSARWMQADTGTAVPYYVDPNGQSPLSAAVSTQAATDAFAAWTNIATAGVTINNAGALGSPLPHYSGCGSCETPGQNRLVFNDPYDEITPNSGCSGVLGQGGFCYCLSPTKTVNGTTFYPIIEAKLVLQAGIGACISTACSLGELITHEVGHTIGLGHSAVSDATMRSSLHLDGRCASVRADDMDGAAFIYPYVITATPTVSATPSISPTSTLSPTLTATPTWSPTSTPTLTPSETPTRTPTITRTPTRTPTVSPTSAETPADGISGHVYYWGNAIPVDGATINLAGPTPDQSTTASGGLFAFPGAAAGDNWSISGGFSGPINGAITAFDASVVLNAAVGNIAYSADQFVAMDVNASHSLSAIDASYILQWRVGLITELPVQASTQCNSNWILSPFPATVANQTITLARPWAPPCQIGSIDYSPLESVAQNQDFHAILFGDANGSWAPAGGGGSRLARTASVRIGRTGRTARGSLRVPLWVETDHPWQAAEVLVRYEMSRIHLRGVRRPAGNPSSLIEYNLGEPGVVRIALARRDASQPTKQPVLMLLFDAASRAPHDNAVQVEWSQVE